jgi:iron complex outermembrane receptor protein
MLLYPPGTAGADDKATPEKPTGDWKKVFHIGTINVSADSTHEEFSFTPTETLIDIDKVETPGPVQNISQIVTRLPIFDGRGSSDLVPSDDSIYMRGFSSGRFTTAIDGMPLRKTGGHQSTNIVDYGELPPWLFETIEVKPGPHFADYPGKSIGGVLNLISRAPRQYDSLKPEVTMNLDYGSYGTHNDSAYIKGGAGKFIYDFGYQYYRTDGYLRHTKTEAKTAHARLGYLLPSEGYITVSASRSDSERETPVKNLPDTPGSTYDDSYPKVDTRYLDWMAPVWDKETTSYRLSLRQPTPFGTWSVDAYTSEEELVRDYMDWNNRKNPAAGKSTSWWDMYWDQKGGKIQNEFSLFSSHLTTIGMDFEQFHDHFGKTARWNYPLEDHKRFEALSGFIQDKWTIAPGLNLLMGLRYEDVNIWVSNFSLLNQTFITGRERWIERKWNQLLPKSFLTWDLDGLADGLRDTSVSLGVSKVWHAPDYHGYYQPASRPAGAWLDPEHGMGYDLVFSRRIAGDLNLKINYAYYEIKDFMASNSSFASFTPPKGDYDFQGLEYSDWMINLEKVVQQTVEFQVEGHLHDRLSVYFGYAFLDFDSKGSEPAGQTACDQRARHRVSAGFNYSLFERTSLLVDYRYQDKQVSEKSEMIGPDEYSFTEVAIDDYHVMDAGLVQELPPSWFPHCEASLKLYVKNLFDTSYVTSDGFPATDRTVGASLSLRF